MARSHDSGSASVEFAIVLPAIAFLLGVVGIAAQCGMSALRVQDAASAAARTAITDPDSSAIAVAQVIAGADATVAVVRTGQWITVEVEEPTPWGFSIVGSAVTRDQD